MSFKISISKAKGTPVVQITGELAGNNVGSVAARLEKLRTSTPGNIAVDLNKTTFIDSHGLGVFVYCWRLLENDHRTLVFIRPQGFILNMFQNTNLDRVFRIVESPEAL